MFQRSSVSFSFSLSLCLCVWINMCAFMYVFYLILFYAYLYMPILFLRRKRTGVNLDWSGNVDDLRGGGEEIITEYIVWGKIISIKENWSNYRFHQASIKVPPNLKGFIFSTYKINNIRVLKVISFLNLNLANYLRYNWYEPTEKWCLRAELVSVFSMLHYIR